jgi:hypothetical protein
MIKQMGASITKTGHTSLSYMQAMLILRAMKSVPYKNARCGALVEALRYKPEGRGINSWNPQGPSKPVLGLLYLHLLMYKKKTF